MSTIIKYFFSRPSEPITLAATTGHSDCTNCSSPLTGSYCHQCGQKKIDHHDATIGAFLGNTLHEFTHIDSKVVRTFKYLIFKPGYLTQEFIAGHRKKYMNPVQLFIVINLLYFVFISFSNFNTFTTPLVYHLENGIYGKFAQHLVENKIRVQHLAYPVFEEHFNHELATQAKSLVIVMVPIFSIFLGILYFWQKRYFVEHLVFSINLFSFYLLALSIGIYVAIVVLCVILQLIGVDTSFLQTDSSVTSLMSVLLFGYLFVSLRRVYNNSRAAAFLNSGILVVVFWSTVFFYRFLLFLSVFYSIKLSLH